MLGLYGRLISSLILIFSISFSFVNETSLWANEARRDREFFDEVQENRSVRDRFKEATGISDLDPQGPGAVRLRDQGPFGDGIRCWPRPWMINPEDYELLRRATSQRARALAAFFRNLIFEGGSALPQLGIPEHFIDTILQDSYGSLETLRRIWSKRRPEDISFLMGSDVLRAPNGRWMVFEDNIGNIGGMADRLALRRAFLEIQREHSRIENREKIDQASQRLNQIAEEDFINLLAPFLGETQEEQSRALAVFKNYIAVSFESMKSNPSENRSALVRAFGRLANPLKNRIEELFAALDRLEGRITSENSLFPGLFSQRNVVPRLIALFRDTLQRVLVFLENVESPSHLAELTDREVQNRFPATFKRLFPGVVAHMMSPDGTAHEVNAVLAVVEAKNFLNLTNMQADGLMALLLVRFASGDLGLLNAPGTVELLGHKMLLIWTDRIIEHFLGERPLIETVPTRMLDRADYALFRSSPDEARRWVFKIGSMAQGDGVTILANERAPLHSIERVFEFIEEGPDPDFILQRFVPFSTLDGNLVDLRPIASFNGVRGDAYVSRVPFARMVSLQSEGKTNISQGGYEVVVFTEDCGSFLESRHER